MKRSTEPRRVSLVGLCGLAAAWAVSALVLTASSAARGAASQSSASIRQAHVLELERTGVPAPVGLAYSASGRAFHVVGAGARGSSSATTEIVKLTPFELAEGTDRAGTARVAAAVRDPINMTVDGRRGRLLLLVGNGGQLLEVGLRDNGDVDPGTIAYHNLRRAEVQDPQGVTVDPVSGNLYVLDGAGPRIVRLEPDTDGGFTAGAVSELDLRSVVSDSARGIALDPSTGRLHVRSGHELHELTTDGEQVSVRDLSDLDLVAPEGMVFAPSADLTDDPERLSLYVADSGGGAMRSSGQIVELSLAPLAAAESFDFTSSLVHTIDTSTWSPPSPDTSGLAYLPTSDRMMVVDSEVNETVDGITHFQGANVWETTLGGAVIRTANISKVDPTVVPMTDEPTGVAFDPATGTYFFTDDNAKRVFRLNPGADGLVGTADDTWTDFRTNVAPSTSGDPEGITYDTWNDRLFVADGVNAEIYEFTTAGTLVGQFDVEQYAVLDPEAVEFNTETGTLYVLSKRTSSSVRIVEVTTAGALLQTIDVSVIVSAGGRKPAGLAYAPASDGSGAKRFYIADRGRDNNPCPTCVDGKIFELTAPVAVTPGNTPPTVDAGPDQALSMPATASLDGTATDDGVPNPLTTTWSQVSGPGTVVFGDASAVDTTAYLPVPGTYVLRLTATDGELTAFDEITLSDPSFGSVDVAVAASSDDAEEKASGSVSLTSSDLELVFDGSNQTVGIRFNGVTVPQGATIVDAYVQFQVDEVTTDAASLSIQGHATGNAPTFTTANGNISSRPRTAASVPWSPEPWPTVGVAGPGQRTPNLAPVVQEIVNRGDWSSGNSLAFVFTGTGKRTAEAFDGTFAPQLHVEYTSAPAGNQAPTVDAGPDQTITLPDSASLSGSASDDGLPDPPGTLTTTWSKVSGPGTVTFGNANALSTSASFSEAGTYVLRLTAFDGALSSSDELTVTVNPGSPTNQAPVVNAGSDQTITFPESASLSGSASDDGLPDPPGTLTTTWSKVSGPGTVTFENANALSTSASFSQAGTYVLRLTASDGELSSFDELTVTVNPAPLPDLIFADGFESGNFSAWSSATTGGGNLSVTAAAALVGGLGMEATIASNSAIYVTDDSPQSEPRYRARFYFHPNSIPMRKSNAHYVFQGLSETGAVVLRVEFRWNGTEYQLRSAIAQDGASFKSTGWFPISGTAANWVELDWRASSAPGANNGSLSFWINGVLVSTRNNVDNDTRRIESVRLGALDGIDKATRGTYYFDAFESRRQTQIGP